MKTTFCLMLVLCAFIALSVVSNIFAQDAAPKYIVRVIYIVPNDREPNPDMDAKLDTLMKKTQQFYAELMEFHGFGRKTFRLETDATGDVIVHHVDGKHNNAHYQNQSEDSEGSMIVWDEIQEQFDTSKNIYVLALDISDHIVAYGGTPVSGLAGELNSHYGYALIPAFNPGVALWHELGHTFGLTHDSRTEAKRWNHPDTQDPMITSFCAAEWLNVSRYFNPIQDIVLASDNEAQVKMLKPTSGSLPYAIKIQFEATDSDGLHHAQLSRLSFYDAGVIDCTKVNGKEATIEFETSHVIGGIGESVQLRLIDVNGNFTSHDFPIDITDLLPQPEIVSIPDPKLALAVRETLELAPDDAITQLVMRRLINLTASDRQITDLTGLEYAHNVRDLWLDNNQIKDLTPLSGLTELTLLDLSDNPINDIEPLAKIKNLSRLDCRNAQISDITPLANLTSLRKIDLAGNPISDIAPLARLTKLFELSLGSSQQPIGDIAPLAELASLQSFTLLYASIKDTNIITRFTELTYLSLYDVPIDDLNFLTGLSKLKSLELTSCKINDVRLFAGLNNLAVLKLRDNQISDVSPLAKLANLEELDLAGNPIEDKKPLGALLRANPNVKIYLEYGGDPLLLVKLSHFRAKRTDAGVVLKWTAESEFGNAGFNILRSDTKDGRFKVLNPELIQGVGNTGKHNEYTWTDKTAKPNTVYYYQIEGVSHAGVRKQLASVASSSGDGAQVEPLVSYLTTLGNIKRTALLQNYPNPFNPETWIPYQLAEDAMVTLTIYNSSGLVVRTLELGNQSSGSYESRDKAAFWDGRNEDGEVVTSGVYFYQFRTGDYSALRRMVIVK